MMNNKINYLKEHISWAEKNVEKYMSNIKEDDVKIGK